MVAPSPSWVAKAGDAVTLRGQLLEGDTPIPLDGREVWIRIRPAGWGRPIVWARVTIVDAAEGRWEYPWQPQAAGDYWAEIVIDPDTPNQATVPASPTRRYLLLQVQRSLAEPS